MKTTKIGMLFILCMFLSVIAHAQPSSRPVDPVSEGDWVLSLGIGPSAYGYGSGPGFQIAVEKGMWQLGPGVLTLGGELGFSFTRTYHKDFYKYTYFTMIMAARSAYHYGWNVRGLDTYGGLTLGFRFTGYNETYYNGYYEDYGGPARFGPHFGAFVGASYFFSPKVGLNGEFGYNINFAQIGVIFKLN